MAFIIFAATDGTNGTELWRTDGTAAGTEFLLNLNPGLASSNPANFTRVGDYVFFSATTAAGGSELWRTDGTAEGTERVKDIVPGPVGSFPTNFVDVNGTLFFSADNGSGQELWKSDGTADGTVRVKDIVPGSNGSFPDEMINADGILYFTATSEFGTEVWRSDGTEDGTVLVHDTFAGSFASGASRLTYLDGNVYYLASNGTNGFGLWKTSTSGTGATLVEGEFALAFDLMTAGGKLFFTVLTVGGRQLWTSDGTAGGTNAVAGGGATNLTAFNGFVYFTATGASGSELWRSDGNTTTMVADIAPGSASSSPSNLEVVGNLLYFTATNGSDGVELWKTDGTTTSMVRNINTTSGDGSSPVRLTAAYHKLLFSADDGSTGLEPWSSNGTTSGTVLLKEIAPGTNVGAGIEPDWLTVVGSRLFFRGHDTLHGDELWATDGSALGTYLVKDIEPGAGSGSPFSIFDANGIAIFNATTTASGQEPWRSDGTETGTTILFETGTGPDFGVTGSYTATTTHFYFFELDPSAGYRLWTTDGTSVALLYNSNVGLGSLTGIGNTLYFSAWDAQAGIELWKSNGTAAGTVRVADINPGGNVDPTGPEPVWRDSTPSNFTEMNGAVFFTAETETGGRELYRLDNDTVTLVKDIVDGPDSSSPNGLFNFNGLLLFDASEAGGVNSELWRSDGTPDGTFQLKDINTSAPGESSSPFNFILFNNEAYFIANDAADPDLNRELWKTDGTEDGTVLVKDINGDANAGSDIGELTVYGDYLYFAASDGVNGLELWRTDGTADGTELFGNINTTPGQGSAVNGSFDLTVFNGLLYFAANDGTAGPELWRTDGTVAGTFAITDVVAPAASNPLGYGLLPNNAPTATAGGGLPNYVENAAAIIVDSGISVDDVDNTTFMGAMVSVTGNFASGQDILSFTDQNGITGSYNGATGVLTLAGEATLADYQTALRSVTYTNSSDDPSTATRTISFVVSDGIDPSIPAATTAVTVTAINDTPVNTVPGTEPSVNEDVQTALTGFSVADVDADPATDDIQVTLAVTEGTIALLTNVAGGIEASDVTNNSSDLVTITATQNQINATLAGGGLLYTGDLNFNGSDTLTITTNDLGKTGNDPGLSGDGDDERDIDQRSINVEAVNDVPTLDLDEDDSSEPGNDYETTFAEKFPAVAIADADTLITDVDDANLSKATVTLTNHQPDDLLSIEGTLPPDIVASSYNSTTGELVLSGPASLADYQTALRQVVFSNSSDTPSVVDRIVTVTATDAGLLASLSATATIHFTPFDGPTLLDDEFATDEATAVNGDVSADNGSGPDVNPDELTIAEVNGSAANVGTQITLASGALLTVNSDGTFAYDPNGAFEFVPTPISGASNQPATESFTYSLELGGETATATITITGIDNDDDLEGSAGADALHAGGGNDTVQAFGGNDRIIAGDGAGNDSYDGGDDTDTIDYRSTTAGIIVNLAAATNHGRGSEIDTDQISNVENVIGGSGNDRITGDGGRNALTGEGGLDTILGGDDDDSIWGRDDGDFLYGQAGADMISGENGEDRIWGGDNGDELHGKAGADIISGENGDDRIWGGTQADQLHGKAGTDQISGDEGDDQVWGGTEGDALFGKAGVDTLSGDEGDDFLYGGLDNDFLYGKAGVDTLSGDEGDDRLWGGTEGDFLFGRAGNDILSGEDGADGLWGGANDDYLYGGAGADSLNGEAGNDVLRGEADVDTLFGKEGDDYLDGGDGGDTVRGDGGNDRFYFDAFLTGADTIVAFEAGPGIVDRVLFDNTSFTNFAQVIAASTDTVGGVLITLDGDSSVLLAGRSIAQLAADDFAFV